MADLDLLTFDEAAAALSRGAARLDDDVAVDLAAVITAASVRLDHVIGAGVIRTITEARTARSTRVLLSSWPIVSITSVTNDGAAVTDYRTTAKFGTLHRECGWSCHPDAVEVTFTAGRAESTVDVESRIKVACQIVVRHMWEQDRTLGAAMVDQGIAITTPRSFSIPKRALDLVRDLTRPTIF